MSSDIGDRVRKALAEAMAGAGGIILSAYFVYPLDYVKTRLQLPGSPYSSMSEGFRRIISEEGFLTLYQGVESELLKGSLQNFLYFFSYDLLKGYARDEPTLTVVPEERGIKVGHTRPLLNRTLHCYCHGSATAGVRYAYRKEKRRDAPGERERRVSVSADGHAGDQDEDGEESIALDAKETRQIVKVVSASKPLTSPPTVSSSGRPSASSASSSSSSPPAPTSPGASAKAAPPQLSIVSNLLIGIVAGCFCQLFINPLSVIQTRLMTQAKRSASPSPSSQPLSSSILSTALSIWRLEGFSAFYTGLLPAFILTTNPAIQFLVFDRLKAMLEMILQQHQFTRPISAVESFVIGAIAKITATLATYPYIMAKLRLQYRGPLPEGQRPYQGTVDVIVSILKADGLTGLYAGLRAQLLKSVLGAALMFMMKEQLMVLSQKLVKRRSVS